MGAAAPLRGPKRPQPWRPSAGTHWPGGLGVSWLLSLGGAILRASKWSPPPQEEGRWERVGAGLSLVSVWTPDRTQAGAPSPTRFLRTRRPPKWGREVCQNVPGK